MIIKVIITRFELYPQLNPTGKIVGFLIGIKTDAGVMKGGFYKEAFVPMAGTIGKTDIQVVEIAWQMVKVAVKTSILAMKDRPTILGVEFIPPSGDLS